MNLADSKKNLPSSRGTRNLAAEAAAPVRPNHTASRRSTPRGTGTNRSHLGFALVPLALLGITCGFSLVQRATAAITAHANGSTRSGRMTADEAARYADSVCTQLIGTSVVTKDVSGQSAYSWRRHTQVREWNVLCDSSQGEYLLRINADTKRVYAVNRMDAPNNSLSDDSGPVSRGLAEQRAREYLRLVGVSGSSLKPVEQGDSEEPSPSSTGTVPQWNFTYRHHVPGLGERLLKVSVNGANGSLEHVWNPVNAM